jgi:hypothetical protein
MTKIHDLMQNFFSANFPFAEPEKNQNAKKFRNEHKYVSPEFILQEIQARLDAILPRDEHSVVGRGGGSYANRSVYFDDYYDTCFRENEDGTDPREKFRIRIYNCSAKKISLELKQKEKGLCHKISCPVSAEMCAQIFRGEIPTLQNEMPFLLKKFICQMQFRALRPVVIVAYERVPFVWREGNVRITFDRNIRSSRRIEKFFDEDCEFRGVLPVGTNMMEVKFDEFLPDFINETIQTGRLGWTSFSKYYLCRKFSMAN